MPVDPVSLPGGSVLDFPSRRTTAPVAPIENFDDTDVANAKRIATSYGDRLRYTEANGWLVWDGRRWKEDPKDVRIQAIAKDVHAAIFSEIETASDRDAIFRHAKKSQSAHAITSAITLARSEPGVLADLIDFDSNQYLLNIANGTLDLRTGQLLPHDPAHLITKLVPIDFDATATAPRWSAFIERITGGDRQLVEYLHRLVGYMLTGSTEEQVLHFLYGVGANGKSVFCEIVAKLLGEYAVIASPDLVMAKKHGGIPNDIARLRGVRSAFMNETSQGSRFDEAKLKDLTGGDRLTGRFLHREFFDFEPSHKLVIRGNHKPVINGTDEGIWRRLRLMPFTVQIPESEQDRRLLEKLSTELPGILRWAVDGCLAWQRDGLKPPARVLEAVAEYRSESDTLGRFIAETCEVSKLGQVKAAVLYQRYREFAEQSGERAMPSKDLPLEMQRRGFAHRKTKACNLFEGIELRQSEGPSWSG